VVAIDHGAAHLVVPTEQRAGAFHVAGCHQAPDGGRRHRAAGARDQAQPDHVEAQIGSEGAQQGDVAPPAPPEMEVLPHHDETGAERSHQEAAHELARLLGRPGGVESDHHRPVDEAGGVEHLELLVDVGQEEGS